MKYLFAIVVLVSLSASALFAQNTSVGGLPSAVSDAIPGTPLVGPFSVSPLFSSSGLFDVGELYRLSDDPSNKTFFINSILRMPVFVGGTFFRDVTDYSFAVGAPATTIIGCPAADALVGSTLFVADAPDSDLETNYTSHYSRLAYIVGKGATGQQLHLKLHESIFVVLDEPSFPARRDVTWLSKDSNNLLKKSYLHGQSTDGFLGTPANYYYEAVAPGITVLSLASIKGYRTSPSGESLEDLVTFTIQVDKDDNAVSAK